MQGLQVWSRVSAPAMEMPGRSDRTRTKGSSTGHVLRLEPTLLVKEGRDETIPSFGHRAAGGTFAFAPVFAETMSFPAAVGEPYTGRMTVEAFPVDGGHRMHRARGDAEVRFSASGEDQILFDTTATLDDGGSLDLSVTLAPDQDGAWRSLSETGPTETAAGRILSVTELDGFHMILTGQIGPEKGKLTLRRIPLRTPARRRTRK